ncbi:CpaE family protein [Cellulosimicrobium cellulans]|uniref:AAA family ATPase n=1 Tax=Cellulosimicrobium cellulans TaxID=1710 RepID=UPI0036E66DD1
MSGATTVATVLCAVRGAREAEVVTTLAAPGLQVTRRCADVVELLAAAAAGAGRVAVVSCDLPALDRQAVVDLHAHDVRVVALAPGGTWEEGRVRAYGVDAVVDLDSAPGGLCDVVRAVLPREAATGAPGVPRSVVDVGATGPETEPRRGRTVAVWGPTGAPGRTTVATNLAAELAGPPPARRARPPRRERPAADVDVPAGVLPSPEAEVLLVDADTYGGSVAQRLGLLDESPGLAAAARSAGQGALDDAGLVALAPTVLPRVRVLTGLSRAARWPELPGASLDAVWEVGRSVADWTVVDCGFGIERDELLTYDTRAPQRNDATWSALGAADVVVVVGAGDPVGLQRLVRALDELAETGACVGAARAVVVNRVRASVVGPRPERAVRDAMARYANVDDLHVVPEDGAVDLGLREGRTLAESAPVSPARRALARLAAHVREAAPSGRGAAHGLALEAAH